MRMLTSARANEKGLVNSTVAIISSLTLLPPDTCSHHRRVKTQSAQAHANGEGGRESGKISDLEAELGNVQGDRLHGGDDLSGLLDFPGDDEMKAGLFHQVLHVLL